MGHFSGSHHHVDFKRALQTKRTLFRMQLYNSSSYLQGHFLALCSTEPQMLYFGCARFRAFG